MNMRTKLMALALAAFPLAGNLAAEDAKRFDAGIAWSLATDNLKEITNATGTSGGYNLDFGYNGKLAGTTVPTRISFGVNNFPGHDLNGVTTSLLGYQLAGDLFIDSGMKNLSFVTGVSLNKWSKKLSPAPAGYQTAIKGTKFGARLGLEYQVTPSWSVSTLLQVVEVGTDAKATKGLNASWVQLGAKYHF